MTPDEIEVPIDLPEEEAAIVKDLRERAYKAKAEERKDNLVVDPAFRNVPQTLTLPPKRTIQDIIEQAGTPKFNINDVVVVDFKGYVMLATVRFRDLVRSSPTAYSWDYVVELISGDDYLHHIVESDIVEATPEYRTLFGMSATKLPSEEEAI